MCWVLRSLYLIRGGSFLIVRIMVRVIWSVMSLSCWIIWRVWVGHSVNFVILMVVLEYLGNLIQCSLMVRGSVLSIIILMINLFMRVVDKKLLMRVLIVSRSERIRVLCMMILGYNSSVRIIRCEGW